MKLRSNERCPIHQRFNCCGREKPVKKQQTKYMSFEPGVRRVPDEHHPRGYREIRSASAMRKLLNRKIKEQDGCCGICSQPFSDYNEVVPDHIEPRGMGAARRDDHPDNIQAAHSLCNLEKGSRR